VTIAPTYSLVAPLLPASSRWINSRHLARDGQRTSSLPFTAPVKKALLESKSLKLFMVSAPRSMKEGSVQPDQNAINTINRTLNHMILG
jgi:hypothetical protein